MSACRPVRGCALRALLLGGGLGSAASGASAQIPDIEIPPAVQFQGEIGSHGEYYSVSGREQRRPTSTGRLYLRSRVRLFDVVSVELDLLYSTEQNSGVGLTASTARQQLNQIGIKPEWSWGRAYLGSFTDSYSPLTWDGVRVQGVGAAINPGLLRLGAFTGRTQRAVAGGAVDGAYSRWMSGGRLGVGRASSPHAPYLDVVFLRVADDPSSLAEPDTMTPLPTAAGDAVLNPYAVTPEEYVVSLAEIDAISESFASS